jgi:cell division protein FtsL
MSTRSAQVHEIYKNRRPLLHIIGSKNNVSQRPVLYGSSGLFYVSVVIILMACLGLLLNIGLRVQNINYQNNIYDLNEMILLEEERADRLRLEISSLKAPSRIQEAAEEKIDMDTSGEFEIVELSGQGLINNEKIYDYIARDESAGLEIDYDNLLGTIYYIQDIVLVVSESVLTFFIP